MFGEPNAGRNLPNRVNGRSGTVTTNLDKIKPSLRGTKLMSGDGILTRNTVRGEGGKRRGLNSRRQQVVSNKQTVLTHFTAWKDG